MWDAIDFLEKAERCRRLAASIGRADDPAIVELNATAVEFEAKADALVGGPAIIGMIRQILPTAPEP